MKTIKDLDNYVTLRRILILKNGYNFICVFLREV